MDETPIERTQNANPQPANEADVHLQRLLAPELEESWFHGFKRQIHELLHPQKLPPLELTSKPVPVKEIWGFYGGQEKTAGLSSVLIHGSVITLLFLIGTN